VLKPGKSWLCTDGHWQRAAVRVADSPQAARAILDTDPAFSAHPFLVQEFVEGQGAGIFALYHHGHAQAFFAHRRIREKPPSGGVSVLSESITPDPVQLAHARALLDTVDWHGVAMVEYRVAPDGTPWLMEINTRFWGSLQLAVDAGADFPWLLYRYAMGDETPPKEDYASGRRLRWLLGDLDHLYLVLRDRHCTLAQKLRAGLRFIWPSPFRTRHEINRWSDPAPAWFELKQWLRELL
jgi:predicted ATP-grasp superfamily ATP-dependent carboligase